MSATLQYSQRLPESLWKEVEQVLRGALFQPVPAPNTVWALKREGTRATLYATGTLYIQGPQCREAQELLEPVLLRAVAGSKGEDSRRYETHAGLDESGKGDVFGPVVTACVVADRADIRAWEREGVRDSKLLSDREIFRLETVIKSSTSSRWSVMAQTMQDYNFYIGRTDENMNVYVAWLHAQALRRALHQKPAPWGLLDKFAGPELIERLIWAPQFTLYYRTKAEQDTAVAAASIMARAAQLRAVEFLSQTCGIPLPRGASMETQAVLVKLNPAQLERCAKMNFEPVARRLAASTTLL